jgi:hypothetical protein
MLRRFVRVFVSVAIGGGLPLMIACGERELPTRPSTVVAADQPSVTFLAMPGGTVRADSVHTAAAPFADVNAGDAATQCYNRPRANVLAPSFEATVIGTAVTVRWIPAPTGDRASYWCFGYVYGAGTGEFVFDATQTSVSAAGLSPDEYFLVICGGNAAGLSDDCADTSFTIAAPGRPNPPRNLGVTVAFDGTVTLRWDEPAPGGGSPTTYVVRVPGAGSGTFPVGLVRTVSGRPSPGSYEAWVFATNAAGDSLASNHVRFTVPGVPPGGNLDGRWSGTTAQDMPITFAVANRTVTTLSFGWIITGFNCVPSSGTFALSIDSAIANDTFSYSRAAFTIRGTFSSTTSAYGIVTVTVPRGGPTCSGDLTSSWSARR